MVVKDGAVLLGKRKGSHAAGEYAFPGGHLEYMETFEETARREAREEAGIEITNIRFQYVKNELAYTPKHYVHIGVIADWQTGEPAVREPDKCEGWHWYPLGADMPEPLMKVARLGIESYHTGVAYYPPEKTDAEQEV